MAGRSRFLSVVIPVIGLGALALAAVSIARHQPDRPLTEPVVSPPVQPASPNGADVIGPGMIGVGMIGADMTGASPNGAGMIGAVGLIEAASEQIAIAAEVGGIVTSVTVRPGDTVRADDPLFTIDDRAARADLAVRAAALAASRERAAEAETSLGDLRDQLDRGERMSKPAPGLAISDDALTRRRYAVRTAEARLNSAHADVLGAEAQVRAGETAVALLTVRAPIDATVLQTNIRAGEFAPANTVSTPLMILGQLDPLHVRVDIDEADVPRFDRGAEAWGSLRGAAGRRAALSLVRVDPIVVPKTSLTGAGTERVDTRVLRVVYAFDPRALPAAFPGGQMDVFVRAGPPGTDGAIAAKDRVSTVAKPGG